MRDELGVLLVEDGKGIAVQLFSDPEAMQPAIDEMKGKPSDKPSRITWFNLHYKDGDVRCEVKTRDLPIPVGEKPDGYMIGEGPVRFNKEEDVK